MKRDFGTCLAWALGATMVLAAGSAYAGDYDDSDTLVFYFAGGGGQAMGGVSAARNSSDGLQSIGCSIGVFSNGSVYGSCHARTAAGEWLSCTTTQTALLDQMRAISPASHVHFSSRADGGCSYVIVNQSSRNAAASTCEPGDGAGGGAGGAGGTVRAVLR